MSSIWDMPGLSPFTVQREGVQSVTHSHQYAFGRVIKNQGSRTTRTWDLPEREGRERRAVDPGPEVWWRLQREHWDGQEETQVGPGHFVAAEGRERSWLKIISLMMWFPSHHLQPLWPYSIVVCVLLDQLLLILQDSSALWGWSTVPTASEKGTEELKTMGWNWGCIQQPRVLFQETVLKKKEIHLMRTRQRLEQDYGLWLKNW